MRQVIAFIPLLLFIGTHPALAAQVDYTIDFTLSSGGPLPSSGSFVYDSSTSTFTNFEVAWNGDTYDFTSAANSFAFTSPTNPCYSGSTNGAQEIFLLMTACSADNNPLYTNSLPTWQASKDYNNHLGDFYFATYETLPQNTLLIGDLITYSGPPAEDPNVGGAFASNSPEPGSCALMLIGLGLMMRKRIAGRKR